jgi:L-fuconolactonase
MEDILEPDLPIVDSHHHLWFAPVSTIEGLERAEDLTSVALAPIYRKNARYLFDEFLADIQSGHNIVASVYCDAQSMYRADGPAEFRSVGEVEFVNGIAAMGASGLFGNFRPCAGIVGGVDLSLGERVEEVLVAHIQAGGGRYRGVRAGVVYDDDPRILGGGGRPHVLIDKVFREGFKRLAPLGLSFDAMVLEPQLADVVDLARAYPETQIILNHVGVPVGIGQYAGRRPERFPIWRSQMKLLATCENVVVKIGGLGIPFGGFDSYLAEPPLDSAQLAAEWRPYVAACIEMFGVDRCMFESNAPPDFAAGSYRVLWNAFKRLASDATPAEKTALFSRTATRVYRLEL